VRVIGSVPQRFSHIYVTLISAVVSSETNTYITDAYFAPDYQMLDALEDARPARSRRTIVACQSERRAVHSVSPALALRGATKVRREDIRMAGQDAACENRDNRWCMVDGRHVESRLVEYRA
jgi:phosphatidylserine/phosphatidylglycerophosphate/cardiolipin synthase-like enzyme